MLEDLGVQCHPWLHSKLKASLGYMRLISEKEQQSSEMWLGWQSLRPEK